MVKQAKPVPKEKAARRIDKKGLREARAATTMTREEWSKHQVGMKEKWPAPEYMKISNGKGHTSYRDETFELVTRFTEDTKMAYRPHAKAPGTKSHVRYERYAKAKTVGEALKLGSWPEDWCWDIERGFIKILGPVRDEPLDVSEIQDDSQLTDVDAAVIQWSKKEIAKKFGLNLKELMVEAGCGENLMMRAHRLVAQREAKSILAKKGRVTNEDMGKILGLWGFARNTTRVNVMRKDQKFVWSDTLGLLRDRTGDIHLTSATHRYPEVIQLMARWLTDRLPATEAADFKWTSFNVNKNYAAKIHRDGNNFGPSMIAAFGDFTGGALNYHPHDDGRIDLDKLQKTSEGKAERYDLKNGLAMFNGNSAHHVDDFEGTRYSVVWFTLGCHAKMKPEDRTKLHKLGVAAPKVDENPYQIIRAPLGERSDKRYSALTSASPMRKGAKRQELPPSRYWTKSVLEVGNKRKA